MGATKRWRARDPCLRSSSRRVSTGLFWRLDKWPVSLEWDPNWSRNSPHARSHSKPLFTRAMSSKRKYSELDDSDDEEPTLGRQVLPVANLPEDFDGEPEDGMQYLFTVRFVVSYVFTAYAC